MATRRTDLTFNQDATQTTAPSSEILLPPTSAVMRLLSALIITMFLAAQTVYFSLDNASEAVDSPVKTVLLYASYSLAAMQALLSLRDVERLVIRLFPYLGLVVMVFATAPLGETDVAITRGVHALGLFLIAVSARCGFRNDHSGFVRLVFAATLVALLISIAVVLLVPARGYVNLSNNNLRWIGITGHPNGLGALAIVCCWSLLAILHRRGLGFGSLLLSLLPLTAIVLTLYGSQSRSSQLAVLVLVYSYVVLWGRQHNMAAIAARMATALLLGILLVTALAAGGVADSMVTVRAGANDALSGRPAIWSQGLRSIVDDPLGVSFDNLQYFWSVFSQDVVTAGLDVTDRFTHFHNGFIDVTAKGGVICGLFLLLALRYNLRDIVRTRSGNYPQFVAALAFFVSMIVYNLEETSFMRETLLWPVQLLVWALLPFFFQAYRRAARSTA